MSSSLPQAEEWFLGSKKDHRLTTLVSARSIQEAESALRVRADAAAYLDLLPYILDPHGPGSRLSVRRDPSTRAVRSRKREEGVFYTPADVADYMANACVSAFVGDIPTILDPACGTGVFLRAVLGALRQHYPEEDAVSLAAKFLFGIDIDPLALDATAFVLLADIWTCTSVSPVALWKSLRRHLACIDTLRIDPTNAKPSTLFQEESSRVALSSIFPDLPHGPVIILGNPPYANLGVRSDLHALEGVFRTIAAKPQPNAEVYLAFIEQMVRLADAKNCAGALVIPLSIACNVGSQFTSARQLIAETPGRWRFAFFDREPHALFGEDVKTRNAIVLWSSNLDDKNAHLETGPLRKWHGDSRAQMFRSLRFTRINTDVRSGIPKIEGDCQAIAVKVLSSRCDQLEQALKDIGRCPLAALPNADDRTVFVGPTAYNFLNVFLKPSRKIFGKDSILSEHTLHVLTCASRQDALVVFAILSSHLAFWWWHSHGDGFHVSRRFLCNFPFGLDALSGSAAEMLACAGEALWSTINTRPIISLNRGRTSLAFTPNGHDSIRRQIDQILADLAGLQPAFIDDLQQFTAYTIAATWRNQENSRIDGKEGV
ncbi:N-6 DNA methylase [Methylacidimicrobium tartarophylax]|uniref:N-6 DNA methylase n=1 Tax=Methylacidimicrobium tartarophylax TaxID=1041768 RepID=UPI0015B48602|nr:N-6 DNA methylase [Methylacidimicrobium tartarophylax]